MGKIFFYAALALALVAGVVFAPEHAALAIHPMDQFIVTPLFGGDHISWYTPTNVTLWMGLAVVAVFALLVLGSSRRAIVPSRAQSVAELAYGFIYKMVEDVAGKDGVKFFPYIMTLFMFIVMANFLGLLPMSFTTTSHIAVTAVLAALVSWACSGCRARRCRCAPSWPSSN